MSTTRAGWRTKRGIGTHRLKKEYPSLLDYGDQVSATLEPTQLHEPLDMAEHWALGFFYDVMGAYARPAS